jgi:hypothetical protein
MKLNQIWHCPRPKLAGSYLALLGSGLVVSTSIFAPRRTGKTVFLRQDLTPAAVSAGYLVAYADLWQTRLNPGMALIRALEEALEPRTAAGKALGRLGQPVRKLKAQAGVAGMQAELELELAGARKEATDMALRIEELVARLVAKQPLLLLVDEAQELARTRDNELMAMALRTAMTKHRDRVRVVFTGSSRSQLAHVFSNADAPLYAVGSTIQDFPLLGRELVEFVAEKFLQACGRTLDVAQAWVEFRAFAQQPEPFLSAIVAMLMDPALTLEAACAAERAEQDREENHEGTWVALDPLQRHLVLCVAADPLLKPFSKTTLAAAAKALGLHAMEATSVQYALRSLAARNVVSKSPRGVYTFENAAFERWVRTLAPRSPDHFSGGTVR